MADVEQLLPVQDRFARHRDLTVHADLTQRRLFAPRQQAHRLAHLGAPAPRKGHVGEDAEVERELARVVAGAAVGELAENTIPVEIAAALGLSESPPDIALPRTAAKHASRVRCPVDSSMLKFKCG